MYRVFSLETIEHYFCMHVSNLQFKSMQKAVTKEYLPVSSSKLNKPFGTLARVRQSLQKLRVTISEKMCLGKAATYTVHNVNKTPIKSRSNKETNKIQSRNIGESCNVLLNFEVKVRSEINRSQKSSVSYTFFC